MTKIIYNLMIKRQTLTSQVFDHILNLIKSGQFKPGEKLPTEKQWESRLLSGAKDLRGWTSNVIPRFNRAGN